MLTGCALHVACSPADMMPSTTATFKQYLSYFVITLYTEQECHSTELTAGHLLDDVEDDDAWSPRPGRRPHAMTRTLDQTHRANFSITIEPVTRHPLTSVLQASPIGVGTVRLDPPTHYMAAGAEAPLLYAYQVASGTSGDQVVQNVAFQPLNHVVTREAEDQMLESRYEQQDGMHPWRDDGQRNHVGQVWARKMQREKEAAASLSRKQVTFTAFEVLQPLVVKLG